MMRELFDVCLWTRGARFQERLSGPYTTIEDARFAAHQAVKEKPEGSTIAIASYFERVPVLVSVEEKMKMIERVAQAVEAVVNSKHEYDGIAYAELARAAIEAMMTPTEAMIAAVNKVQENGGYVMYETVEWQDAWPVAITAALEE